MECLSINIKIQNQENKKDKPDIDKPKQLLSELSDKIKKIEENKEEKNLENVLQKKLEDEENLEFNSQS